MKAGKRGGREQGPLLGLKQGTHRTAMVTRKEIEILRFLTLLPLFFLALLLPNLSLATVGKPMIVYSEDETASLQYSQYSSSTWATGATAASTSRKQFWKVVKTHPNGNKKVVLSVESPASGNPHLYATLWDESSWDDGSGASFNDVKDLGEIYTNSYRCFDAAYEQSSGKLLVVAASTSANTLNYWTWNGSTWSSVSTYTFTSTMANIHWVKMASKPGANQIALFVADSGKKGNALIWSGSSWGNELNLTSSLSSITTEAIAVQYINGGGTYAGYGIRLGRIHPTQKL